MYTKQRTYGKGYLPDLGNAVPVLEGSGNSRKKPTGLAGFFDPYFHSSGFGKIVRQGKADLRVQEKRGALSASLRCVYTSW
jgi:hypothetical protein